jgi:hypothetical protein
MDKGWARDKSYGHTGIPSEPDKHISATKMRVLYRTKIPTPQVFKVIIGTKSDTPEGDCEERQRVGPPVSGGELYDFITRI